MARPVIALLTDFGLRDHYVAAMKGVILDLVGDVTFVDITHEIPPQDVVAGALELAACWRFFPAGSIFLVVVDPGVGTTRRAIALSAGSRSFVAPDNGVLELVLSQEAASVAVELTDRQYQRPAMSRTFEGRDRFAPAAAWLARGTDIRALGPVVSDVVRLDVPHPLAGPGYLAGVVLKVDRFGNAISNISDEAIARCGIHAPFVRAGDRLVQFVTTYGGVAPGSPCALVGSSGYVEIAVNGGSAARVLDLAPGTPVAVAASRDALDSAIGR